MSTARFFPLAFVEGFVVSNCPASMTRQCSELNPDPNFFLDRRPIFHTKRASEIQALGGDPLAGVRDRRLVPGSRSTKRAPPPPAAFSARMLPPRSST